MYVTSAGTSTIPQKAIRMQGFLPALRLKTCLLIGCARSAVLGKTIFPQNRPFR